MDLCFGDDAIGRILAFLVGREDRAKDSFSIGKCQVLWADNEVV